MTLLLPDRLDDVRVVPLSSGMQRVTRTDGIVLGYLEQLESADETAPRFRAKRMLARERRFALVGDYWTRDDALEALRVI